jgi:hypothetical protein
LQSSQVRTAEFNLTFDSSSSEITPVLFAPGKDGVYALVLGVGAKTFKAHAPGFYDYCYARVSSVGALDFDTSLPIGRYIVLPAGVKREVIHTMSAFDERDPIPFDRLRPLLESLASAGVTSVYLTGAIERCVLHNLMSVADHAVPSRTCGGLTGLFEFCAAAAKFGMRVMIDFLPLVAMRNWSRKYMAYQTTTIDENESFCTGTITGTELMLINMRSPKFWDVLSTEMIHLSEKAGVSGFYLGELDSWDLVYPRNMNELLRHDPDGGLHYFKQMIIEGSVVDTSRLPCGIRMTDAKASPFLVKLIRKLWLAKPDAFVWMSCAEESARFVIESGIIPQTEGLVSLLRQSVDHALQTQELTQISVAQQFNDFFAKRNSQVPKGSIFVASFGGLCDGPHAMPVEGIGLALDILCYLSDIPLINGVLDFAIHLPNAYQNETEARCWTPQYSKFTDLLQRRTAIRLRSE